MAVPIHRFLLWGVLVLQAAIVWTSATPNHAAGYSKPMAKPYESYLAQTSYGKNPYQGMQYSAAPAGYAPSTRCPPYHSNCIINSKIKCYGDYMEILLEFEQYFDGIIYVWGKYDDCNLYKAPSYGRGVKALSLRLSGNTCPTYGGFADYSAAYPGPAGKSAEYQGRNFQIVVQFDEYVVSHEDVSFVARCDKPPEGPRQVYFTYTVTDRFPLLVAGLSAKSKLSVEVKRGDSPYGPDLYGPIKIGSLLTLVLKLRGYSKEYDMRVAKCWAVEGPPLTAKYMKYFGYGPKYSAPRSIDMTNYDCSTRPKLIGNFVNVGVMSDYTVAYDYSHTIVKAANLKAFRFPHSDNVIIRCKVDVCYGTCSRYYGACKPVKLYENSKSGYGKYLDYFKTLIPLNEYEQRYSGNTVAYGSSDDGYGQPSQYKTSRDSYGAQPTYGEYQKEKGYASSYVPPPKTYAKSYPAPSYPAPSYPAPSYPAPSYPAPSYPAPSYPAPTPTYPAPAPSYPAPAYTAPTPTYPAPAPSYPAPAPSYPAPAPSYPAPAPSYPASTPTYPAPAPSYRAPAPSYPAPAPSYPAPSYPAPAPSYPAPAPSYPAPAPSYPAPAPSYPAPTPSYPAPAPSYPAPAPSYPAPAPSYPAPAPTYPAPSYPGPVASYPAPSYPGPVASYPAPTYPAPAPAPSPAPSYQPPYEPLYSGDYVPLYASPNWPNNQQVVYRTPSMPPSLPYQQQSMNPREMKRPKRSFITGKEFQVVQSVDSFIVEQVFSLDSAFGSHGEMFQDRRFRRAPDGSPTIKVGNSTEVWADCKDSQVTLKLDDAQGFQGSISLRSIADDAAEACEVERQIDGEEGLEMSLSRDACQGMDDIFIASVTTGNVTKSETIDCYTEEIFVGEETIEE